MKNLNKKINLLVLTTLLLLINLSAFSQKQKVEYIENKDTIGLKPNSMKLVESATIYKNISKIAEETNVLKIYSLFDGKRPYNSGDILGDGNYFYSEPIPVIEGQRFAKVSDLGENPLFAFYNSENTNASSFIQTINSNEATVPTNATHLVFAGLISLKNSFILQELESGFPTLGQVTYLYKDLYKRDEVYNKTETYSNTETYNKSEIDLKDKSVLANIKIETNLVKNYTFTDGYRKDNNGNNFTDSNYSTSEVITVIAGERYGAISNNQSSSKVRFSFYDTNDIFISWSFSMEATVPLNATKMVLSIITVSKDSYIIKKLEIGFPVLGENTIFYPNLNSKYDIINISKSVKNDYNIFENNKFLKDLLIKQGDDIESNATPLGVLDDYEYIDADSLFGYNGRAFKMLGKVDIPYFGFTLPQRQLIKSDGYKKSEPININIEFHSEIGGVNLPIIIYENFGVGQVEIQAASIPIEVGYNVLNFDISTYTYDADRVNFEIRLVDFGTTILRGKTNYIGRINAFTGNNSDKLEFDYENDLATSIKQLSKQARSLYYGKKASFLGNSITYQRTWIPDLCNVLGLNFNSDEITAGLNGYSPTAVGGSTIVPFGSSGNSIHTRAKDLVNYSPDVVFIFGGQNDRPALTGSAVNGETSTLGTLSDTPYTGVETSVLADVPSFYASLKGIIEGIISDLPNAQIILITPMQNGETASSTALYDRQLAKVNAVIEIGQFYGILVVDLFSKSAINHLNYTTYYKDGIHPNYKGGARITQTILNVVR